MESQSELWIILEDEEQDRVWDKISKKFHFNSRSAANHLPTFQFDTSADEYDVSKSHQYRDDETINDEIIKSVFMECMGNDAYLYVLEWQSTCFRYNPRINKVITYPVFMEDERHWGGGYNVYFPKFYPDGDFYFFVAKDFRWGYFTHPWLQKVWTYGDDLKRLIRLHAKQLDLIPCADQQPPRDQPPHDNQRLRSFFSCLFSKPP